MRNGIITVLWRMPEPEIILRHRNMPSGQWIWNRIIISISRCYNNCSPVQTGMHSGGKAMEEPTVGLVTVVGSVLHCSVCVAVVVDESLTTQNNNTAGDNLCGIVSFRM